MNPKCEKPGCGEPTQGYGSRWCAECYYPGIDRDAELYQAYREDGYSSFQAKIMVGWADPPEK